MTNIQPTTDSSSFLPPEPDTPPPPARIVEAMLFVGGRALTPDQACDMIQGMTTEQFVGIIESLNDDYKNQGRPYLIQKQGAGYVMNLRSRFSNARERLFGSPREAHLSQAAVDVLALVAYRQPATKQEIDSLRGAESANLLRQLVRRGLIAVIQRGAADRKETAYGTTGKFLEFFGLGSLDDLPQTQDLQQI